MVTSIQPEANQDEVPLTGFAVRIYDERGNDPHGTDPAVEWTTYWELTWNAVPGAVNYLIYYITAEGKSSQPHLSFEPRWRLSVARGAGPLDRSQANQKALLQLMAAQLQVIVRAHFVDGSVGPPSPAFPVGETSS